MNMFRLQLRFLVPLVLTLGAVAGLALPLMDRLTLGRFEHDLDLRGALVTNSLADSIAEAVAGPKRGRLQALFDSTAQDERLMAVGLCGPDGRVLRRTARFPAALSCAQARQAVERADSVLRLEGRFVHVGMYPVKGASGRVGDLLLLRDMSSIERRTQDTRRYLIIVIAALGAAIAIVTVVVAQLSWRGWVSGVRALLRGEGLLRPLRSPTPELAPLASDLRTRLQDLDDEYRRARSPDAEWCPDRLRGLLRTQLRGDEIIVVSNREPYIHESTPAGIIVKRPASGLVTAIEPVLRACSDRARQRQCGRTGGRRPRPRAGTSWARRIHAATRLAERAGRAGLLLWFRQRRPVAAVPRRARQAGVPGEGLAGLPRGQPALRRRSGRGGAQRRPGGAGAGLSLCTASRDDPHSPAARDDSELLAHPVAESRILRHLSLAARDRSGHARQHHLGFHTRFHCKNFIETVDRYLEARIEHEHSTICFQEQDTLVESYPISIEWPGAASASAWPPVEQCRRQVIERLGLAPDQMLAVGVDRLDYTKGILERMHAVERLLERHQEWIGRFVLVQIAAPSRSSLEEYRLFQDRIGQATERINRRFGRANYRPIHLLAEHHDHDAVTELYRAADVGLVTSLHDGMDLVCKEFVAARDDERGVLILSRFAGAAREMSEALIVNP